MTSDTYEIVNPFKIEIDKGNKHKRFFEKGLNALLADPHFLLLYVPEDEGSKMQVVRPANDTYHQKRIKRKINEAKGIPSFYYALSHLWGLSEDNRYYWDEIKDYVDDENGNPMESVSMRPEKRDPLLALLKDHPGSYWWIDVLCARRSTPLDIMGDIYSCCLECIAMIDCEPTLIPQLLPLVEEGVFSDEDDINRYQKLSKLVHLLFKLRQSRWWNRVWTWQEMALPFGEVCLMAEKGTHQPQRNTITVDDLLDKFGDVPYFTLNIEYRCKDVIGLFGMSKLQELDEWIREIAFARKSNKQRVGVKVPREFYNIIDALGKSQRHCYDPVDYVYGVLGMFEINIERMSDPVQVWRRFVSELDNYMEKNGFKIEETFDSMSSNSYKISYRALQVNLLEVKNMTDVYKDLLEMSSTFDDRE
ncbi:hypothetical protein O0I10_008410 [Lichtheimia ornata]|uniref:Heterokaryon incompatibility domain-containing protein n=1 Tax=Lichtheimia ornata TaxID=688661 RepID=A0AAD7XVH5_9FUNG|nr:uncharacterized protein O0I10_008410 [Lichtheimia ornata]KAJ8655970.1 hypothetical protein O0I10_008410 [Lichtheimia ornata]